MRLEGLMCSCEDEPTAWPLSPSLIVEALAEQANRSRRQLYFQHIQ